MDPLFITIAFVLGFLVRQVGLPPVVGFLAAGFVLHALGLEGRDVGFAWISVTLGGR